jgi:hypothetical protein
MWARRRPAGGYGLAIVLIAVTYVLASASATRWTVSVLLFVQIGTVWYALRTSRAHTGVRLGATVLFALTVVAAVWNLFTRHHTLVGTTFLLGSLLYVIAPVAIVRDLGRRPAVDRELMLGALAAYLMIGMAFGFTYRCLAVFQPGAFFGGSGDGTLADSLFFSFVTLTTTGYGNLVPAGNPGRSFSVLEALLGQLFLVTAVAKIVNVWRPRRWREHAVGDDESPS